MPYITHQFGRTYFQRRGRRRSQQLPLICLHGGPGGHSRFMTPLLQLADERQVYLYDQIGGGRSSPTSKRRWTINTFVRELDILTNAWNLDRFHLFGASWGTTLALEYFLKQRQRKGGAGRVASLMFQSPMFSAHDWQKDAEILIKKLPAEQRKVIRYCHEIGATDAVVYQQAMQHYYDRHVCRNKSRSKLAAKINNAHGSQVYEAMWGASEFHATGSLKNYDRVGALAQIDVPTLLVCGEHDEARPATARRYAKQMPFAQFHEIEQASHAIVSEKPAKLIKTLRGFLQQVESQ